MSELAYDQNGDRILLPAQATHFLVRCFPRPGTRGAPRICLDRNGSQLRIPVEQPVAEFTEKVDGRPGRYRLDPCDEHGRIVPNVPPAYFTISDQTRNSESGGGDERDGVIRDLARANAEMTKSISERFASVMQATADLLRVTASLPPRPVPVLPPEDPDDDEDDDQEDDDDRDERPDIASLLAEMLPTLQLWLSTRAAEKAAAAAPVPPPSSPTVPPPAPAPAPAPEPAAAAPETPGPSVATPAPAATSATAPPAGDEPPRNTAPTITAAQLAHLTAIQARLTPKEVRVIQTAALRMTPLVRAEWLAELATRSVDDAIALVRSMLPKLRTDTHPEAES